MTHFNNVVRLATTLRPRDVTGTEWYIESKRNLDSIREKRRLAEENQKDKADKPFRDLIVEDLTKLKAEAAKGNCAGYLKYLNEHYTPAARKLTLTDEMLSEEKLKRLITTKFSLIYHPDRNRNEARQVQILREEIMKTLNIFLEEFK